MLNEVGKTLGVIVEEPHQIRHNKNRHCEELLDHLKKETLEKFQILLIVLDRNTKNWYVNLKREFIQVKGVPTQVVLKEKIGSSTNKYFESILNQMVMKMGGIPYTIGMDLPINQEKVIMIN
jgi:hypothetical protein